MVTINRTYDLTVGTKPPASQPSSGTIFGMDVSSNQSSLNIAQEYDYHVNSFGRGALWYTKYYSPGDITANSQTAMTPGSNGVYRQLTTKGHYTCPVVCFKGGPPINSTALDNWMTALPAQFVANCRATGKYLVLVWYQEIEDPSTSTGLANGITIAQYKAAYAAMDTVRKSNANGDIIHLLKNLTSYNQSTAVGYHGPAGSPLATMAALDGGQRFVEHFGYDGYGSFTIINQQHRYSTPEECFDDLVSFTASIGIRWCVPEFGMILDAFQASWPPPSNAGKTNGPDTNDTIRLAMYKRWFDYLKNPLNNGGAEWASIWCAAGSVTSQVSPFYHLDGNQTGQPAFNGPWPNEIAQYQTYMPPLYTPFT